MTRLRVRVVTAASRCVGDENGPRRSDAGTVRPDVRYLRELAGWERSLPLGMQWYLKG